MTTEHDVLDAISGFIREIAYAKDELLDALTLTLAVSHASKDVFTTKPRFLVTSKEPGSGKSTLTLDIPLMLAHNPWQVGKATSGPALMHKFTAADDVPTLCADDVGKIFGDSGNNGTSNPIYAVLIDGYRNTATVSMSRNGVARDYSSFGVAFMNGLHNAVPADLRSRAVCAQSSMLPDGRQLRDALDPGTHAEANALRGALRQWVGRHSAAMGQFALNGTRRLHRKLNGRKRQVWGPLFAVAHCAGGEWPARCMTAFVTLALDQSDRPALLPDQQILLDTADVIKRYQVARVFTSDLVGELRKLDDRELYRDASDEYLVRKLSDALGPSRAMRSANLAGEAKNGRGRDSAPILRAASALRSALLPDDSEDMADATDSELTLTD